MTHREVEVQNQSLTSGSRRWEVQFHAPITKRLRMETPLPAEQDTVRVSKVGLQEMTKTKISITTGDRMQISWPRNPHYTDWATQLAVCCRIFVTSGNKMRKRRQYVTPKRWSSPTRLHGVTSQTITISIFIAVTHIHLSIQSSFYLTTVVRHFPAATRSCLWVVRRVGLR